jgi:hypothetical protein
MLTISGKSVGRRRPLFADFSVPIDIDRGQGGGLTLRELISRIVRGQVVAFRERQTADQFVHVLTSRQIDEGITRGKVAMGQSEVGLQSVDEEAAIATALQAFEDGLYFVIIDEIQFKRLDEQVYLKPDSRATFVKLALLAGG